MSEPALNILDLKPADTPDYMIPAWLGCIAWALGDPDIMAAFRAETGNQWTPPGNAIDRMVDDATGAGEAFVRQFVGWVNEKVWGPMDHDSSEGNEG
jgi:hypothetical protein